MQQPAAMIPVMPSFPQANITTEQIQKYLDENKRLILAILDNQNLGKLAECAQYQAQLQKNLMYLAAIADAQPQAPTMPPQMAPHPAMQQGGYFTQHPQAAMMQQQQQSAGLFQAKMPMQFNNLHQLQDQQQQQHQLHQQHQAAIQAQMAMRPLGPNNNNNGMPHPTMHHQHHHHHHHPEGASAGGGKQDASDGGDGQGAGMAAGDGEDGGK